MALDLLREMIDAASTALAEAAELGRDVGYRRGQLAAVESRLDQAVRLVERGRQELASVAAEIARATLPEGACGASWPACRRCLGTGLQASGGESWCPSCGRSGGAVAGRSAYLCTEKGTVTIRDAAGREAVDCLSHAAAAVRDLPGLTVIAATDDEVQALLLNTDRPIRVDMSGRPHRLEPVTRTR